MNLPNFITFTGASDGTDIQRMVALSRRYPIEWGILFDPSRQGMGRHPSADFVQRVCSAKKHHGLLLAAHLCGRHSRSVIERCVTSIDELVATYFARAQVNMVAPELEIATLKEWATGLDVELVLQCRDHFPRLPAAAWLFDKSGGRGITPKAWPTPLSHQHATGILKGYAGGIGPDNVAAVVGAIGAVDSSYWLDMESRVRDERDRFDLDRCEQVCEAVYGARTR